jgi:hypothetical protein
MFAKIVGKRTTALATSLAVVVGLAIVPAVSATAAEGDTPVVETPVVEVVETPPAEPVIEPAPLVEPVPLAEPVETPLADPAPLAEPVEAPTQQLMRSGAAVEPLSMGIQAVGISPSSVGDFVVGQPVSIQFSAAGAEDWRVNLDGFRGVDMSNSGHLTGSFSRLGSHAFTVTATKSVWNPPFWIFPGYWSTETVASQRYTFNVLPGVLTTSLPEATVGVNYSQTLAATPDDVALATEEFTLVSGSLPAGLTLNRSTGTISGTVTNIPTNPATYNFAVRYTVDYWFGGALHSAPQPLSITVGYAAPVVTSATLPSAMVGLAYTAPALTASGQGTITWSATGLPAGLTINSGSGVISGSPLYNAAYGNSTPVAVTVIADNGRASAPRTLTLTVFTPAPQFGAGTLPNATVGVAYDATLPLHNAYGDITFALETGTLPAGLLLTADGHIAGTPLYDASTGASKYVDVRVSATGTAGTNTKLFNFQLLTPAPVIDTDSLATGWWNQEYSQVVETSGPGVVVTVTGLPTGMSFDGTTITGSTRMDGDHTVTITATNGAGEVTKDLTLTINAKPNLHRMPADKIETGHAFTSSRVSFDGEDVTLTLGSDAPAGMTLTETNRLTWTPTAPGVFKFTITATNPAGTDTRKYTIRVFDAPVITQSDLDQGVINMPFRQKLQHDGTNVKFKIVRGDLPEGLTLSQKGVLKGVPTEAGVYSIKVRAKNPVGFDTMWFNVTVLEPAMTASASSIIRGGSVTITGTGYLPGDTLELWLHSTPVLLGAATATDGTFSSTVVIPANTPAGLHQLVVKSARSGTQSAPLTVALPAAVPQATTPQSQSPQLAATAGDDESAADDTAVEEAEQSDDTAGGSEEEAELPTLNEPEAEEEAAAEAPANLSGLLIGGFALLLAALLLWFILWRRRRAAES